MKILHVIPSIAKRYGGPSTAILPMVAALNGHGLEASIVATDADGAHHRLQREDIPDSLPLQLFPRNFSESWKVSLQMWRWLRSHVNEYDIVHIHAIWSFSTESAVRACIKHDVPYVIRPAGMLSSYSWRHKGWKKQIYWRLLGKNMARHAAAFHATSPDEKRDIKRVYPAARVFVIPNGVEESAFTHPVATGWLSSEADLKDIQDLPVILFLSRLHPKKGIVDRLLPAIAKMQTRAQLLIVGGEDSHFPGYKSEVEQTIRTLNLGDSVILLDAVSGDERWRFFDLADVFVLPSHSENFGIVIAEAMARGCTVVTTHDVQAAPLVEQAKAGITISGESGELAQTLDAILSEPDLREKMGFAGQKFARENFRWHQIGEQIVSMYACLKP